MVELNKKGGGDWEPMFIGLFIALLLSIVLGAFILDFSTVIADIEPTGVIIPVSTFVDEGIDITFLNITFFGFDLSVGDNFNFFDFLPDFIKNFVLNTLIVFSLIPDIILVPALILLVIGFAYTIIKLLPTT